MSFGIPVRNGLAIGLLSSTTLSSRRGLSPAMYLNFLQPFLDSRITFTRGSNATLVDSTGKITYAPANLLLQSQTFETASWTKNAVTVTANTAVAPDGTSTADTITESATNDLHVAFQTNTLTALTTHIMSVYVQAGTRSFAMLRVGGGGFSTGPAIKASLTGAGSTTTLEGPVVSSAITSVGGGWYRVSMTFVSTATTAGYTPQIGPHNNGSAVTYLGDGSTVFIWGAQLEPVTYQTTPGTYVATTASAYYGPRFDYDPVTLAPKGLLIEEQRTNAFTYSDQFNNAAWTKSAATISTNSTLAPDGTTAADTLIEDATNAFHAVVQSFTLSGTTTISCYLKANTRNFAAIRTYDATNGDRYVVFNLATGAAGATSGGTTSTITPAGNGWYRCSMTYTYTSASGSAGITVQNANSYVAYAGDGTSGIFLYGAQLEAGAFATSYIPTVASTVTRSADVATMTGTNFSSWYNASEGTFTSTFNAAVATASVLVTDAAGNGRPLYIVSGGVVRIFDGTAPINAGGTYTFGTVASAGSSYGGGAMSCVLNGGTVGTGAFDGSMGTSGLYIGRNPAQPNEYLNGHIRQIAYYNTRLPDTQLQTLTAPSLATTLSLDFTSGSYNVGF